MCCTPADFLLSVLAIIFPPIPVWIKRGLCSADSLINLALCLLGFVPGLIHAWYIIFTVPEGYERVVDVESGRGVVRAQGSGHGQQRAGAAQPLRREGLPAQAAGGKKLGYGAVGHGNASSSAAGPAQRDTETPPSYADALKGDHKVQSS